jgi:hypothetical protein
MTKTMTMTLAVMVAGLFSGCGAAKVGGGKDGAAAALSAASKPTKSGADLASTPVDLPALNYTCPEGGSATMSDFTSEIVSNGTGGSVAQVFTLTYKACGLAKSEAGVAIYDGSFKVEQRIEGAASGGTVAQRFSGRVTISGAFTDFLEADVTQTLAASALGADGASMKLVGTLKNAGGSYTYDESLSVSPTLPVAP